MRRIEDCGDATLVIVGNPNNPDGQLIQRPTLLTLAQDLRRRGGVLVIDEAFMDVERPEASLAADVAGGNVVVLRSFGKFFGLAGVRLGFAIAAPALAARLGALLGPWAVSGPALAVGKESPSRHRLDRSGRVRLSESTNQTRRDSDRLNSPSSAALGLFRLVQIPPAQIPCSAISDTPEFLPRAFPDNPTWLRFGLPRGPRGSGSDYKPRWLHFQGTIFPTMHT